MKDKLKHKVGNPDLAKAMAEKRRSSAASPHTLKKYKGSRSENLRKVIKEEKEN